MEEPTVNGVRFTVERKYDNWFIVRCPARLGVETRTAVLKEVKRRYGLSNPD
jgi:hypothetical protein